MKNKRILIVLLVFSILISSYLIKQATKVQNVFDEMYYSGENKINHQTLYGTSWEKTGCVYSKYNGIDGIDLGTFNEKTEYFSEKCLPEKVKMIIIKYCPNRYEDFVKKDVWHESEKRMTISVSKILDGGEILAFYYTYTLSERTLLIKINTQKNYDTDLEAEKITLDEYYTKYNTSQEETQKHAEHLLYDEILPIYFDKNEKKSKYNIDDIGRIKIEYGYE